MTDFQIILQQVGPLMLVLARMSGLFLFAPVLGSPAIPRYVRVVLTLSMTLAVWPLVMRTTEFPASVGLFDLGFLIFSEALIGAAIGLLASMPIIGVQLGGLVIGQQMGLALASVFNPELDSETSILGELLLYMATAIFLIAGGLDVLFLAIAESFGSIPPGGFGAADAPLGLLVGMLDAAFDLAMRVAAPVLGIIFLETVTVGVIMKTMPQLNVLSIGFPVKIIVGLMVLVLGLVATQQVVGESIADALNVVLQWVRAQG